MNVRQLDPVRWLLPKAGGMRTDGLVFADEAIMRHLREDKSLEQVANVAHLPGIRGRSLAMPDIHWGYGFPIGGVAAFDAEEGVISPGGVGYDINCGVRLLRSDLTEEDVRPKLEPFVKLHELLILGLPLRRSQLLTACSGPAPQPRSRRGDF